MKRIHIMMLLCAAAAKGGVLAPATVTGSVFFNLEPPPRIDFSGFGTHRQTGPGGMVQFSSIGMPMPAVMAEVDVKTLNYGRSSGVLSYDMEILGPAGDVSVEAVVTGAISASTGVNEKGTGFAVTAALAMFDKSRGKTVIKGDGISMKKSEGSHRDSFALTRQMMLSVGRVYRIDLRADAAVAAGTGAEGSGMAFLYPMFRFGSGAGSGYSFAFSSGIGNGDDVATPEPGAMGLMSLGVFAIWGWKRRRQP
ncbi:MAG: PEP-CTERM sorting domain-containing protein [Bryobacterales bacterium]|nr:PEP-CTERM sorting domain-containing protein [Bryobacterales bacterium]